MADPYVYAGTNVLKNKLDIRDAATLRNFEMDAALQRIAEGLPRVPLKAQGYQTLHRHIFQDIYEWAGELRTVDISKPGALFCKVDHVSRELDKRFAVIAGSVGQPMTAREFVGAAAEHVSELNAIHPFRKGNGRVMRAFLEVYGQRAGHAVNIERIDPVLWHKASIESFQTTDTTLMKAVIAPCLGEQQSLALRRVIQDENPASIRMRTAPPS